MQSIRFHGCSPRKRDSEKFLNFILIESFEWSLIIIENELFCLISEMQRSDEEERGTAEITIKNSAGSGASHRQRLSSKSNSHAAMATQTGENVQNLVLKLLHFFKKYFLRKQFHTFQNFKSKKKLALSSIFSNFT